MNTDKLEILKLYLFLHIQFVLTKYKQYFFYYLLGRLCLLSNKNALYFIKVF